LPIAVRAAKRKINHPDASKPAQLSFLLQKQKADGRPPVPVRRVHHLHRRVPRLGLVMFAVALWLTLGLISQAAFQLIG
jgi:hypothetical protein